MKTDDLFYKLMQALPTLPFQLAHLPLPSVPYQFRSVELKEFSFRLDGLLLPTTPDPSLRILAVEAQMQPDPNLYYRIHGQLSTYLNQYRPANPWSVLVIYPDADTERSIPHLERYLTFWDIHRVYLDQLSSSGSFGVDLLRLIVEPPQVVETQGMELVRQLRGFEPDLSLRCLELITELMNRKFPERGEKEIRKMLGLAELEQTKAYQEGLQEGLREGLQEGLREGLQEGLAAQTIRILERKLGPLNSAISERIQHLTISELEALGDSLMDFASTADLEHWLQTRSNAPTVPQ